MPECQSAPPPSPIVEDRGIGCPEGLDAGPVTICWHLEQEGFAVPSTSTIRRILQRAGLINPEPRERPRSSYLRFEAAQPNEMWQSDFMHARLADGTDVEVLSWLDDHSRFLLACTAHQPVTVVHGTRWLLGRRPAAAGVVFDCAVVLDREVIWCRS